MENDYLGTVVYSKAGRDAKRLFIILEVIDKEYVYISDGTLRKVEKPKKKKLKHLSLTEKVASGIKQSLISNNKVNNSEIKEYLQSLGLNKEV